MLSLAHLHGWEGLVFHWLFALDNRLLDLSVPASPTPSLTGTSTALGGSSRFPAPHPP